MVTCQVQKGLFGLQKTQIWLINLKAALFLGQIIFFALLSLCGSAFVFCMSFMMFMLSEK